MPGKHFATELCSYPREPHLDIGPLELVVCARPGSGAGVNRYKYIDCLSLIDKLETGPGTGWHHLTAVKGLVDEIGHI